MAEVFSKMTTNREPRILVVAEFPPGAAGGDWVNIKQHFRGLDWSQIYWWSLLGLTVANPRQFGGRHSNCNIWRKLQPQLRWNGVRAAIMENVAVPYAASHLRSYINSVQPDLIFVMARGWIINVAHRVMPGVKTHWHMAMYDMPDIEPQVRLLGRARADRAMREADFLYRTASSRSVISPPMAEVMRERTGVECSTYFRCSVEPEKMAVLREPISPPTDGVIRICYAGTIHVEPAFEIFVAALKSIRSQLKRPLELHLFGDQLYRDRKWFDPEFIVEHGFLKDADLDREYKKGTWGLAIMHLEDIEPRYNHYSFPCKFSMSLSAGLPLICIGHRLSGLMELTRNYDVGLQYTEKDIATLAEKLRDTLENTSQFEKYRSEMLRCAQTEFNAEANRQKLHKLLYASVDRNVAMPTP